MKNKEKSEWTAGRFGCPFLVLAAGSLWGLMGLLVRSLNEAGLSSMEICFIRVVITFVCMLAGLLLFDRKAIKVRGRDTWCFIGTGAFSVTFFNFCYFKTITLTSLSVAAVMLYTAPAFVMLMSAVLFKEKLTLQKIVALFLAFVGCSFVSGIVGGAGTLSFQGILYGFGAGFGYALVSSAFFVNGEKVLSTVGGSLQLGGKTVFLVLLVILLPYLSYTRGLKGMENGTASVLASIEPGVATLVGIVIYKERLNVWNLIGICLVLGSIVLINIRFQSFFIERKGTDTLS